MSVISVFTLSSGVYTDEQDLVSKLDTFMTTTLSWNKLKDITDTVSDKNVAFYNDGDGEYNRNFVSVRGTSNYVEFHSYSLFNEDTDVGSDDLYNTNTRIPTSTSSGVYWFLGNRDCIHVSVEHIPSADSYMGGFGYWRTYASSEEDPKPVYVYGQTSTSQLFSDSSERVRSYAPKSWGTSVDKNNTLSGTVGNYASNHNTAIVNAASQSRTGQPYIFESVFFTYDNVPYFESRGEIPGIHLIGDSSYTNGQIITISGINLINGNYFIQKHSSANNVHWAIGRVTNIL